MIYKVFIEPNLVVKDLDKGIEILQYLVDNNAKIFLCDFVIGRLLENLNSQNSQKIKEVLDFIASNTYLVGLDNVVLRKSLDEDIWNIYPSLQFNLALQHHCDFILTDKKVVNVDSRITYVTLDEFKKILKDDKIKL